MTGASTILASHLSGKNSRRIAADADNTRERLEVEAQRVRDRQDRDKFDRESKAQGDLLIGKAASGPRLK